MTEIKNIVILGEEMADDTTAYHKKKKNLLNEHGKDNHLLIGDADDKPDLDDIKKALKGKKIAKDIVVFYDSHADDKRKGKGDYRRYDDQTLLTLTAEALLKATSAEAPEQSEKNTQQNHNQKPLMCVVTCYGGVAVKPKKLGAKEELDVDFVAFSSRKYASSMENGDKKMQAILTLDGKTNFEKIATVVLGSAETVYVNLTEKDAENPALAKTKKLTGPKPLSKELDSSMETYAEMTDQHLKEHLTQNIEKLAGIMGVSQDTETYINVTNQITDDVVTKYRESVLETAIERKNPARATGAFKAGATQVSGLKALELALSQNDLGTTKTLLLIGASITGSPTELEDNFTKLKDGLFSEKERKLPLENRKELTGDKKTQYDNISNLQNLLITAKRIDMKLDGLGSENFAAENKKFIINTLSTEPRLKSRFDAITQQALLDPKYTKVTSVIQELRRKFSNDTPLKAASEAVTAGIAQKPAAQSKSENLAHSQESKTRAQERNLTNAMPMKKGGNTGHHNGR